MKALQGDITKLQVDAIVNAANSSLLGGGGVDGFPSERAAAIAVRSCADTDLDVTFCCFSKGDLDIYTRTMG